MVASLLDSFGWPQPSEPLNELVQARLAAAWNLGACRTRLTFWLSGTIAGSLTEAIEKYACAGRGPGSAPGIGSRGRVGASEAAEGDPGP